MNRKKIFLLVIFLLLGIIFLAGGLLFLRDRNKINPAPVFINQASIGIWGPIELDLPANDAQIVQYTYEIVPDIPFTVSQTENKVALKFSSPADPELVYILRLIPTKNQDTVETVEWEFSPRVPEVIYIRLAEEGNDLWISTIESGNQRQLTFTNGSVEDYAVSYDGEQILFIVDNSQHGTDIWGIDRNGENMRQVVQCEDNICSNVVFVPYSHDFTYVLLHHETGENPITQVKYYQTDPNETIILYEQTGKTVSDLNWSPNGKILAFLDEESSQIKFYNLETQVISTVECLSSETGGWAFDSSSMTYACAGLEQINPCKQLVVINPLTMEEGLSPMFEILNKDRDYSPPAWSYDGKWIIFGERCYSDRPTRQLWLVDANTYAGSQITNDVLYNFANYHWDPSSRVLVLQRYEMGSANASPDIMLWRLSTEDLELLVEGGHSPNWLP